jgi:hypothetical protein
MQRELSYELTDEDLLRSCPGSIVRRYPELSRYQSLEQLFAETESKIVFLLILTLSESQGHWTCLFLRDDGIVEWFDSYSCAPETELLWLDAQTRARLGEDKPLLMPLLLAEEQERHVVYNRYDLQTIRQGINTCGRWSLLRALHKDLDDDQFHTEMTRLAKRRKVSLDELVCLMTQPIVGK